MPIGTRGKFAGSRRVENRGVSGEGRPGGVGERWYPDDIWKRHRQTYREEARLALPARASRFVAFELASAPLAFPRTRAYHILTGNVTASVFRPLRSTGN